MLRKKIAILTAFLALFAETAALACNVPVFRYALERWHNDPYEIIVFHRGALDGEQAAVLERLKSPVTTLHRFANATVMDVDLDAADIPESMKALYNRLESKALPVIAVRYPGDMATRLAVWTAPLTDAAVNVILDSPARQKIAERILDGESAVWVMLESGDRKKDDAVAARLEREFKTLETTLDLPEAIDGNEAAAPVDLSHGPELKVAFSILRIPRTNPAEAFFIRALMRTEPDLFDYVNEPTVFPVYGRGRALYALVGAGITDDNIYTACRFLTGACSCEVKNLNPGVDMLMAVDWDGGLGGNIISDRLPPLVGMAEIAKAAAIDSKDSLAISTSTVDTMVTAPVVPDASERGVGADSPRVNRVGRNVLYAVLLIGIVVVLLSLFARKRNKGKTS